MTTSEKMDIDSLTIGQAKTLAAMFYKTQAVPSNPATGKYCIVRCHNAGVHAGFVKQANDSFVELVEARRLWYWKSAFSLSEAAITGIKKEGNRIGTRVNVIIPTHDVCEFLPCTSESQGTIEGTDDYTP
jgi:hypothetical protein